MDSGHGKWSPGVPARPDAPAAGQPQCRVDSCPSQGDTWMLPIGESCHARLGNLPRPIGDFINGSSTTHSNQRKVKCLDCCPGFPQEVFPQEVAVSCFRCFSL